MTARRLEGRIAAVTGAASGIGQAIAVELAAQGATVYCLDASDAADTAGLIEAAGGRGSAQRLDVSDPVDVAGGVARIFDAHESLDILVTAAGVLSFGDVVDTSVESWERVIGVNLTGTFLCARSAIPYMRRSGGGSILTLCSSTGHQDAGRGFAAYVASKGGVSLLTKAMAVDHAHEGIRVNSIAPGPTLTPMLSSVMDDEALAAFGAVVPLGRLGRPEELARAAAFLVSDDASFVTGAVVPVDGAQSALIGLTPGDL